MKYTPSLVLALALLTFSAYGQDEPKSRKNDVGFSARFFNNPASPYLLMYKRQVAPALALRFGIALSISSQRSNAQDNTSYNKFTTSSIAPSLGLEWQKSLAKNFTFYAGTDFRYAVNSNKSEDFANNVLVNQSFGDNKTYTISPFLGLRYNIIEQLYVATEVNLNVAYSETTNTNKNIPAGTTAINKSYTYSAILQPAVGLFFFYRF